MLHDREKAFTLTEMMIVVAIIGLLAALAIPSLMRTRRESRTTHFVNDLRLVLDAFELYAMQRGDYPPDANRGVVPEGMEAYLPNRLDWTAPTPLGGNWDWERSTLGISAGVSAVGDDLRAPDMTVVDRKIDDGDLQTGRFRFLGGGRYTYIVID